MTIEQKILELKVKRKALILSHYYEEGDVQDLADFVGDSFALAQYGQQSAAPVILLAGVVFMGESLKILCPEKTILVPDVEAGCSLVAQSPANQYRHWRKRFPEHVAVTYINSSAEVKALSDVICTSSNAEKIINAIPRERGILFAPDRNLGHFLVHSLNRPMELWPGACEVHILFSAKRVLLFKNDHPGVPLLAHPECNPSLLELADVIGSTSKLLDEVKTNPAKKFLVATESGIFHQMKKCRPDAEFIQAPVDNTCSCNVCPYMKLNTHEKIHSALRTLEPALNISKFVANKARVSLERMMVISNGGKVEWPARFEEA